MIDRTVFIKVMKDNPSDLKLAESSFEKFTNGINILESKRNDIRTSRILNTKRHLETTITALKNLADPSTNKYLEEYSKFYFLYIENLGRWNKKLDAIETGLVNRRDASSKLESDIYLKKKLFIELLIQGAEVLVVNPLISAKQKFDTLDKDLIGNQYVKDESLFNYLLFVEMAHSLEVLGVVTRDDKQMMTKKAGDSSIMGSHYPPALPNNLETEEPEDETEDGEEEFSALFPGGEDELESLDMV